MVFSKEEMSACLRELRARKRVTQQEVADAVGVDATSIYNYENVRTVPTFEIAWRLADFYNVSLDRLGGRNTKSDTTSRSGDSSSGDRE